MARVKGLQGASERYMLHLPLDVELFSQMAELEVLPASVRRKLIAALDSGQFSPEALLARDELDEGELRVISRGPRLDARSLRMLVNHRNCTTELMAELVMRGRGRRQLHRGEDGASTDMRDALAGAGTRARTMLVLDGLGLTADTAELARATDAVTDAGAETLETIMVLGRGWDDGLDDLVLVARELS